MHYGVLWATQTTKVLVRNIQQMQLQLHSDPRAYNQSSFKYVDNKSRERCVWQCSSEVHQLFK